MGGRGGRGGEGEEKGVALRRAQASCRAAAASASASSSRRGVSSVASAHVPAWPKKPLSAVGRAMYSPVCGSHPPRSRARSTRAAALRPLRQKPGPARGRFRRATRPPEKHPHLLQKAYMPTSMSMWPKLAHEVAHVPRSGAADDAKHRLHRHLPPYSMRLCTCSSGFHATSPEATSVVACTRVKSSGLECVCATLRPMTAMHFATVFAAAAVSTMAVYMASLCGWILAPALAAASANALPSIQRFPTTLSAAPLRWCDLTLWMQMAPSPMSQATRKTSFRMLQ